MRSFLLFCFFFFTFVTAWAQTPKFSDDPAKFILEVQTMMVPTQNVNAMKAATMLDMAWNSGKISESQKERVIKFAQRMQAKKMKPRPHFENYFGAIGSAVNVFGMTGPQLNSLMDVIDKTYEKEDQKTVDQFIASAYRFLDTKAIYRTTTNSLRMLGGDFVFEYRYGNEVDEEAAKPIEITKPKPEPKPAAKPASKTPAKKAAKPKNDGWDDWSGWDDNSGTDTKTETKSADDWGVTEEPVQESVSDGMNLVQGFLYSDMPVIKGPAIVFKKADLFMVNQYDSVTIKNTNGVISLGQNLLNGNGGTFAWNTNGNDASVELKKYTFDTRYAEFKAEGATLTYPALLQDPIEGVFEHRNRKRMTTGDLGFPRFASFTNDAKLKNLGENISYRGGFSMEGSKIKSAALDNSLSFISVKLENVRKFKAYSRSFTLGDTVLTADRAGITLYQEKDSITHPGSKFKFSRSRNVLTLNNDRGKFKNSPFVDSYHKMDITADLVVWNLTKPEIIFSILTAKDMVSAQIESQDYFSNTRYQQLKGINSFHPLQMLVGYSQLHGTDKFYAMDVARENKIKEVAVKNAMVAMDREGYIEYNPTTGYIVLKPKAKHYVAAARNKKDFDHITIKSRAASGKNAVLNLENKELLLRGVNQFAFSTDSGAIIVRPDSGIVRVKKNRDMDFNGRVVTPNFVFKGSQFKFSYNDFWIDMAKIDSLIFRTKKGKGKKKGPQEKVEIQGQDLTKTEGKTVDENAEKTKKEETAKIEEPSDFPEDDSVRIQKLQALKLQKKLAKQKAKEEKKKAKALAKAKKEKKKKPQLDEFGDPIEEPELAEEQTDDAPKPVVKKPKPKVGSEKALTGLNGKLYLNKPNNKSGRRHIPGYPMFDASTGATVYFNKPDVLDGAYDSSMYFTIPPFKLDSVGSASQSAVNFKGTFHSNIFPPIETRLTVMPDQSLGFEYTIPQGGFPVYSGKGQATGNITLNANGLQTKGSISYLTTVMKSDSFTFYMDSVTTRRGLSGKIAASKAPESLFPEATLGKYEMKWKVSADSLVLNKPDTLFNKERMDPIKLYNGQFTYTGQTVITPNGLKGNGVAESEGTKIQSPYFVFNQSSFKGNNVNMDIKSDNPDRPALTTKDVYMTYDLKKGVADFAPEKSGFASTEFPAAQFKTSLSGGHWDFQKKVVTMKEPEGNDQSKAFFYSINPQQDSLKFGATSGFYDLSNYTLKIGGVSKIAVNDTYISPADGNVEITEGADIKVLQNSTIAMDTLNQFHKLVQGELDILSRKDFQGFAVYEYKNSVGKSFPIKFGSFTRDSVIVEKGEPMVFVTKAIGTVTDEQKFEMLPKILYRGDVNLTSNKQLMDFDGEMKLAFGDDASASEWFPYKNTVNPDSIRIKIENMKNAEGEPLVTGLHFSNGFSKIYNTFVSKKTDEADLDMFLVDGFLSFDKNTNEFKLGSLAKAYGESYEGNVMLYNNETSVAKYDGKFNLIKNNKDYKILSSGSMTARLDSSRVRFDSFLTFDINLPGNAWAQMGQFVSENIEGLPESIDNSTALFYKMGEFVGNKGVQDYATKTSAGNVPFTRFSPKLIHSLVFNDVKLKWNAKNNAWYSVGKLGLANIDKKDINAQVGGYIEIRHVGESDVITIYLEASPTAWYYLSYNENALVVTSSDDKFNAMMAPKLKPAGTVATVFTPVAGEAIDRSQFVSNFRNNYLGGKGEPLVDYKPAPTSDPTTEAAPEEGEEGTAKKGKKKKGTATDEEGATDTETPADTPAEGDVASEEAPVKKKKKEKVKTEDTGTETPADAPAEGDVATEEAPVKKKKKEKVKTEDTGTDAPVEDAATEAPAEEAPAKKKKKEKEKVEEPPTDAPVEAPADAPAEEEAPVKKKKEKKPKKGEEETTDEDMAP